MAFKFNPFSGKLDYYRFPTASDILAVTTGVYLPLTGGALTGNVSQTVAITTTTPALNLVYTQTTTNTIQTNGLNVNYYVSGAGTSNKTLNALAFDVTAKSTSAGWAADNTYGFRPEGARGVGGYSRGTPATAGINIGLLGVGVNATINAGLIGTSTVAKASGYNFGVIGFAGNTGAGGVQVGGFFSLRPNTSGNPITGVTSAGIMVDNNGIANVPIAEFRNLGVMASRIQPEGTYSIARGTVSTGDATKTLLLNHNLAVTRYGDGFYSINFKVIGKNSDSTVYAGYEIHQFVKVLAGVASLVGIPTYQNVQKPETYEMAFVEVSSGSVRISVIGKAFTPMTWKADVTNLSKI